MSQVDVQTSFKGMWRSYLGGCPHLHKGDIDLCDANEMRVCVYETGDGPCELFQEILKEWEQEQHCPNCGALLWHFSGLEDIPEYLYCPKCNDYAYDYDGKIIARLE